MLKRGYLNLFIYLFSSILILLMSNVAEVSGRSTMKLIKLNPFKTAVLALPGHYAGVFQNPPA